VDIPGVPPALLAALVAAAAGRRLALVGGAVRDLLLHRLHDDPWRGLPDLDLVVEGQAAALTGRLANHLPAGAVRCIQEHGAFGTVAVELHWPEWGTWLLDVASARRERYPLPAENPLVSPGSLDDDLARRDFSVNAMALVLDGEGRGAQLLDPHGGQLDLAQRQLRLLHDHSLSDDPTRLLRAARYVARLGFALAAPSLRQARDTLASWPWPWHYGDPPGQAPPALATRLRMELELLLEREPWPAALTALQSWGALALLDPRLQGDPDWRRRLTWGHRLASALAPSTLAPSTLPAIPLPATAVLFTAASQPLALAERLQLPHRQHKLLAQWLELHRRLAAVEPSGWSPSRWCELLEAPGISADAVALALVAGAPAPSLLPEPALLPDPALVAAPAFPVEPALPARAGGGAGQMLPQLRRPLLRWLLDWRQVGAPLTAADLISAGMRPGPALGARLRRERALHLDRRRF
jgi:poly(A) polymerase